MKRRGYLLPFSGQIVVGCRGGTDNGVLVKKGGDRMQTHIWGKASFQEEMRE
jgi:hypothetical protein